MTTEATADSALDEKACRRPEFDESSVPIVLADGNPWFFPTVGLGPIRPKVVGGRCVGVEAGTDFGSEFDAGLDELNDLGMQANAAVAADAEPAEADVNALFDRGDRIAHLSFAVAICLLSRNYAIPDVDWPRLLRLDFSDDRSILMFRQIIAHARGREIPTALDDVPDAAEPEPVEV